MNHPDICWYGLCYENHYMPQHLENYINNPEFSFMLLSCNPFAKHLIKKNLDHPDIEWDVIIEQDYIFEYDYVGMYEKMWSQNGIGNELKIKTMYHE